MGQENHDSGTPMVHDTAALKAHVAALRAAPEPFAEAAKHWVDAPGTVTSDNVQLWQRGRLVDYLTCGHLRAAEAALAATPEQSLERVRAEAVEQFVDQHSVACAGCGKRFIRAEDAAPLWAAKDSSDFAVCAACLGADVQRVRAEAASEALEKWADGHADYMVTWSPPAHRERDLTICRLIKAEAKRLREAAR